MHKHAKLLGAVAVAGLVAATGSAFTGTGLTNAAGATQFVGGTVSQAVTGATLSAVAYTFSNTTKTAVTQIDLTFATGANGQAVTVALTGADSDAFTCTVITNDASTCTTALNASYTGLTSLAVTVS